MISGDIRLLEEGSEARARLELQRSQVDQLDVFVWPRMHLWSDIARAARANHYDVITAQDPFWRGLIAWRIARRTGAKLNLQVHTDLSAQPFFRRLLARFLLRRADSVRVVSEKIKKQVQAIDVKASVHVLPIYIDLSRFENLEPKPHEQKTILWIGRFEPEKDPLLAVHVLREVQAKGVDVKLTMLGTGSLESVVRHQAEDLPVELPGWQEPEAYLPLADVVLSTSRHESWGASIIEALAAGVPVVAPDVGAAKEAGAFVVDRNQLALKVVEILQQGARGALLLNLSTAEEWAKRWRETLT